MLCSARELRTAAIFSFPLLFLMAPLQFRLCVVCYLYIYTPSLQTRTDSAPPLVIPPDSAPPLVIPPDSAPPLVMPPDSAPPLVIPPDHLLQKHVTIYNKWPLRLSTSTTTMMMMTYGILSQTRYAAVCALK